MSPLLITAFTTVNAAGRGNAALFEALVQGRSGLAPSRFEPRMQTYTGEVDGLDAHPVTGALAAYDCRNNRLARMGLGQDGFMSRVEQARARYGAGRIAVVLGTSTAGIQETEMAYRRRDPETGALPPDYRYETTHNFFALAGYVRGALGLEGPAEVVSTACSSSAKVFASAWRMMHLGLCDAAVVGGVDSLCLNTLYGFSSLELVSPDPCRPGAPDRAGISIGEAAGFALLERPEQAEDHSGVALLGYGESSDAYHMATPHPEGIGAILSMQRALDCAGIAPEQVDYINLHGTATQTNDAMEDKAMVKVFGTRTPCSSTKGWTGHTLGAAGITEAVISALCIQKGFMPRTLNTEEIDPAFGSCLLLEAREAPVACVLSNSFGFGGSNCSLVLGRA